MVHPYFLQLDCANWMTDQVAIGEDEANSAFTTVESEMSE
jgi:hypothetical protein